MLMSALPSPLVSLRSHVVCIAVQDLADIEPNLLDHLPSSEVDKGMLRKFCRAVKTQADAELARAKGIAYSCSFILTCI